MALISLPAPAPSRRQHTQRIPWLEVLAGLLAPLAGAWLGLQLAAGENTTWISVVGIAFHIVVVLVNPLAGLLLFTITSPFARFAFLNISLGGGVPDLGLNRVIAGVLFIVILANLALGRWRLRRVGALDATFLLFFGAMALSTVNSVYGTVNAAQTLFDSYMVPFVLFFAARQLVRDERMMQGVIGTFLAVGVYLAIITIREQLTGEVLFEVGFAFPMYSAHIRKVIGLLGSPTFMGMSLAMLTPIALHAVLRARSLAARGLALLVFAALLVGVVLTYSRAAWLGTGLAILLMGILDSKARRFLLPVLLVAAIVILVFWNSIATSYGFTERLMAEASLDFRVTAADIATRVVRESPLLGIGFNSFGYIAQTRWGWSPFRVPGTYPATHNTLLFVLTSAGLLGLLPYLAFCILIPYHLWRSHTRTRTEASQNQSGLFALGLAVYIAYFVPSLTVDMAYGFFVNLLFFLFMGATIGVETNREVKPTTV